MNNRVRTLSTIVVVALVALAGLIGVSAQSPAQQPDQLNRAEVRQGRGGLGRGGGPLFARLDLTDAQREQIRAIMTENAEGERPEAKRAELEQQLRAAIFADTPDLGKIDQVKSAIAEADAAALARRIDVELKVAQVLTAEQRAKARQLQGPGMRGRGPWRGPGR
jgi:Spy/CpxP family protein refolding chaperone